MGDTACTSPHMPGVSRKAPAATDGNVTRYLTVDPAGHPRRLLGALDRTCAKLASTVGEASHYGSAASAVCRAGEAGATSAAKEVASAEPLRMDHSHRSMSDRVVRSLDSRSGWGPMTTAAPT